MSGRLISSTFITICKINILHPNLDAMFPSKTDTRNAENCVNIIFRFVDEMKSFDIIFRISPFMMVNLVNVVFAFGLWKGMKLKGS